jgi:hypothetical protein
MRKTKSELLQGITKPIKFAKIKENNTLLIHYKDNTNAIRLHNTDVVTVNKRKSPLCNTITLNSGNWRTRTTKDRINKYTPRNYEILQRNKKWYVIDHYQGIEIPFYDGITLPV